MPEGSTTPSLKLFHAYRKSASQDLEQGDLLEKNEAVKAIINVVHPYYLKDDYTHFIVLTQSCDLVRRKAGLCKSRYITLAAVRPLNLVIQREIEGYQDEFDKAAMVCSKKHRLELVQFVQRLHNYNEPDYFYLHSEPSLGFPDPHCAFLRLSVSIKSTLHYQACLNARILSLNDVYQAKLGWRVGDMYSRVGTEDWTDGVESKEEFDKRIATLLDGICKWEEDKRLAQAKATSSPGLMQQGETTMRTHINNVPIRTTMDETIGAVITQLKKLNKVADAADETKISNRLKNDPVISRLKKVDGLV